MSQSDDPFGKGDRTVIRPNPGGRLPSQPSPSPQAPFPPPAPPSRPTAGGWDDWTSAASRAPAHEANPYQPQSAAAAPYTPAPVAPHISADLVAVGGDVLTRNAASLLLLLGRLRASLSRAGAGQLMDQVAQSIQQFETDARAAYIVSAEL